MEHCLAHKSVTLLSPSVGTVNQLLFEEPQSELETSMSLTNKEVNDFFFTYTSLLQDFFFLR